MPDQETANDYVLDRATPGDLDAILAIEHLSFPSPWTRAAFADELDRPWARLELLRHVPSGRIVAFCNYWLVADEVQILNVAVLPEERRRGHAARMLEHIVAVARAARVRVISLEVRVSNAPAAALYRKHGFRQVGLRPKYYANNGEDALLMDLEVGR